MRYFTSSTEFKDTIAIYQELGAFFLWVLFLFLCLFLLFFLYRKREYNALDLTFHNDKKSGRCVLGKLVFITLCGTAAKSSRQLKLTECLPFIKSCFEIKPVVKKNSCR